MKLTVFLRMRPRIDIEQPAALSFIILLKRLIPLGCSSPRLCLNPFISPFKVRKKTILT
ncbi:hypothetical protein BN871_DP_00080 [Paenibacillus sp. P22]|nr:hypothetical protein BN871_DP_00080 [Paenibacillus sp. P22]